MIRCGDRVCQFTSPELNNLREFKNCSADHYNANGDYNCALDRSAYASRYTNPSAGTQTAHTRGSYSVAQVSPHTLPVIFTL